MKSCLIIVCIFLCYANAEKISLEDIERDNLRSEKKSRTPIKAAPSPTQYGFVPVKTAADYAQKGPKHEFVQSQFSGINYQKPSPPIQQYTVQQQQYATPQQQYTTAQQQYVVPQQYTTQQYAVPQQQQQQLTVQPEYYEFGSNQQQYQNYENVQYITDNSINQKPEEYAQQQYVYLQQYPSSSNSIQTVVDTKGNVQYIMYVPSYVAAPSQNVENVVYSDQAEYTQNAPATHYSSEVAEEEKPQVPTQSQIQTQTQTQTQTQVPQYMHAEPSKTQYIQPREPKSLLDSYVPSILQLQYYKQQQQNIANALPQAEKLSQNVSGKVDYVKRNYRPRVGSGSTSYKSYTRT